MPEHTPTPWVLNGPQQIDGPGLWVNNDADAAFIVEAVNGYAALQERLEAAVHDNNMLSLALMECDRRAEAAERLNDSLIQQRDELVRTVSEVLPLVSFSASQCRCTDFSEEFGAPHKCSFCKMRDARALLARIEDNT